MEDPPADLELAAGYGLEDPRDVMTIDPGNIQSPHAENLLGISHVKLRGYIYFNSPRKTLYLRNSTFMW